jgi:rhodanese-related sulfurtransferase
VPTLVDVIRRHGPGYLARFGKAVLPSQVRALRDIVRCRTPEMGAHVSLCEDCGTEHTQNHSCRNRACSQCGADRTATWLKKQQELLLPVPYFHVVFTVPAQLRFITRSHQKKALTVLFRAAFESLSELCADKHHLGGRVGALAVLHTWTRTLEWHPHVHMLVPGGALEESGKWLTVSRRKKPFLVPVPALAEKFRGRFLDLLHEALPSVPLPHLPKKKRWNVYCKTTVQGAERVLEYFGRYVHRTAITNRSIVECTERNVTFRYRDWKDQKSKTMTLAAHEFLRRFLQHVSPRGFHRVRSYGLLHSSQRVTLRRLQLMLGHRAANHSVTSPKTQRRRARCPACLSERLHQIRRISPLEGRLLVTERGELPQCARAPPP